MPVTAGRTVVSSDCEAYQLRPRAFAVASLLSLITGSECSSLTSLPFLFLRDVEGASYQVEQYVLGSPKLLLQVISLHIFDRSENATQRRNEYVVGSLPDIGRRIDH